MDELNYLSSWIQFGVAHPWQTDGVPEDLFARFFHLLTEIGADDGSIQLHEHWALFFETIGAVPQAIEHREKEVEKIRYLFSIGGPVGSVNNDFLREVLVILQKDYHKAGLHEKAHAVADQIRDLA